tara:strand:- start:2893 stop:3501 length:609 start_codon:yes stop_codon:yes gene_type:complete
MKKRKILKKVNKKDLNLYLYAGRKAKNWYENSHQKIKELFPNNFELVCDILAITSINCTVKQNVNLTFQALDLINSGQSIDLLKALPIVKDKIKQVIETGNFTGRKINNFSQNLKGNFQAVTVDRWIYRVFFENMNATNNKYNLAENEIKRLSKMHNISPASVQAILWEGIKILTGQNSQQKDSKDFFFYIEEKMNKNIDVI